MEAGTEKPSRKRVSFSLKRMLIRFGLWLFLLVGILYGMVVWWCASEIASPKRRPVSSQARELMDHCSQSGFTIEKFESTDGMPCLICTPAPVDVLSKKAAIIRGQLSEKEIELQPVGKVIGTILLLHGRTGMKEDYLAVAERFCAVGFRCVIPDLPGHGANKHRFTTYGVLEAPMIRKCYEEAAAEFDFANQPAMLLGQSMGGAEAIHLAALDPKKFEAMVVLSTFDRLHTVIRGQTNDLFGSAMGAAVTGSVNHVYEWKTGVKITDINSFNKASHVRIPTFVIHGEQDRSIRVTSGQKLYHSFSDDVEKKWLVIPEANHNNILITDYPLYATMAEWFLKHVNAN